MKKTQKYDMHSVAQLYFESGVELKLPVEPLKEIYGFKVKMGNIVHFFRGGFTPFNNGAGNNVTNNKFCTNKILELKGFPIPKATCIVRDQFEKGGWGIDDLKFPLVAKPTMGTSCGKDVLCNIKDMRILRSYLEKNFKKYEYLSVEEFQGGLTAYRVLVFFNKVIGVTERIPAQVIGDGEHNILELMKIENEKREKFKGTVIFGELKIDEEYKIRLDELGLKLNDIPKKEEVIKLCYNCNSTRGGAMVSLGKQICKENADMLCGAAKVLDLNIVGFDILCEDINIPIKKSKGVIVEANHNPDITIHEVPMKGEINRVSKIIMRKLIYKYPFLYIISRIKKKIRDLFPYEYMGF